VDVGLASLARPQGFGGDVLGEGSERFRDLYHSIWGTLALFLGGLAILAVALGYMAYCVAQALTGVAALEVLPSAYPRPPAIVVQTDAGFEHEYASTILVCQRDGSPENCFLRRMVKLSTGAVLFYYAGELSRFEITTGGS